MIQQKIKCRICRRGWMYANCDNRQCDTCPYKCKIPNQNKREVFNGREDKDRL